MQQKILNNRYELLSKIGEGGMARVYRGRDLRLGRPVAVKVLHSHFADDVSFRDRFEHEARSAASLSDPRVVDVYDVGQDGDIHYIVMEFVDGTDLKALLKSQGPLPVERAVLFAEEVALGLHAAHQIGLIHRDIKPQNILVQPNGHVRITDFGIAKSHLSSAVTETGVTFGTADYISPEQAQGLAATPRSDIYSLGVVLYEMLTGQLPFSGENSVAVAMRHVRDTPTPLQRLNSQVPPQLEALVLQAMAKEPEARPATGAEFARLLREYLSLGSQQTILASTVQRGDGRRPAAAADGRRLGGAAMDPQRRPLPPALPPVQATRSGAAGIGCGALLVGLAIIVGAIGLIVLVNGGLLNDTLGSPGTIAAGTTPEAIEAPVATAETTAQPGTTPILTTTTLIPTRTTTPTPSPTVTPTPVPTVTLSTSLIGGPEQQLLDDLARLRLVGVALEPRFDDQVPEGNVIAIVPPPGTPISQGLTVSYTLSLGPATVQVPDLRGVLLAAARRQLQDLGFVVIVEQTPDTQIPPDRVIDHVPPATSRLARGAQVTLFVSLGDVVRVPDVFLVPIDEARRRIEGAGLRMGFIDCQNASRAGDQGARAPGTVISFTPSAGQYVARNTEVTLGVRGDSPQQCGLGE